MSRKITKLTAEQERKLNEYRERFFEMAASVECDRNKAKRAVLRIMEMAGLKNRPIEFAENPHRCNYLWGTFEDFLWDPFQASLKCSLKASLAKPLIDSLMDSRLIPFNDPFSRIPWIAFYSYAVDVLGISCSDRNKEWLKCRQQLIKNAAAVQALPDVIVIYEKPIVIELQNGRVVNVEWKGESK